MLIYARVNSAFPNCEQLQNSSCYTNSYRRPNKALLASGLVREMLFGSYFYIEIFAFILSRDEREIGVLAKRSANSASSIFCQSIAVGSKVGAKSGFVAIGALALYGQQF